MRVNLIRGYQQLSSKTKHELIVGLSGYGKGMYGEWYVTKFLDRGFKVIDLNSQSRGEGMFYGIPNNDSNLLKRLQYLTQGAVKPRGYPNDIWMFLGHGLRDTPVMPKNVKICVFNESWMSNEDLKNFIAFTSSQIEFMETFFEMHGDARIPMQYLHDFLMTAARDKDSEEYQGLKRFGITNYATISTLRKRVTMLLRSGLFHRDDSDMEGYYRYVDIEATLKNPHEITSFSTYLPTDRLMKKICIYMLLKKYLELLESRKVKVPILFYIREGGDFYRGKESSPIDYGIQYMIEEILRKGRSFGSAEAALVLDTQYPDDVPDSVYSGFNKVTAFRLPSVATKKLLWKADIPQMTLRKISGMDVGMCMLIQGGEYKYPVLIPPTLHKKADPSFDVFRYLSGKFGSVDYSKSNFIALDKSDEEDLAEFKIPKKYIAEVEA